VGTEVNLMKDYPKPSDRASQRPEITEEDRSISRLFDWRYFDGERRHGYGGFNYDPKYWTKTVKLFVEYYNLTTNSRILDIGCAKGFMLKDFKKALPNAEIAGIDISTYAIANAETEVKQFVQVGNATELPFADKYFDLVISINTIHNLELNQCQSALKEIERVTKKNSFVMVDGWHTISEKKALEKWVLTAKTLLSAEQWVALFKKANYSGDYFLWTV